jgi:hypothetical protein
MTDITTDQGNPTQNPRKPQRFNVHAAVEKSSVILRVMDAITGRFYTEAAVQLSSPEHAAIALDNVNLKAAALWKLGECIDSEDAIEIVEQEVFDFTSAMHDLKDEHDLSMSELSDLVVTYENGLFLIWDESTTTKIGQ